MHKRPLLNRIMIMLPVLVVWILIRGIFNATIEPGALKVVIHVIWVAFLIGPWVLTEYDSTTQDMTRRTGVGSLSTSTNTTPNSTANLSAPPSSALSFTTSTDERTEDAIYDEIGRELEEGKLSRSVWTKSFAEANGDDAKAKALYIRLRFEQLNRAAKKLLTTS